MELENGKTYIDGWGDPHTIVGTTAHYPAFVFTLGGHWFRRFDGRKVLFDPKYGHRATPMATLNDLIQESGDD